MISRKKIAGFLLAYCNALFGMQGKKTIAFKPKEVVIEFESSSDRAFNKQLTNFKNLLLTQNIVLEQGNYTFDNRTPEFVYFKFINLNVAYIYNLMKNYNNSPTNTKKYIIRETLNNFGSLQCRFERCLKDSHPSLCSYTKKTYCKMCYEAEALFNKNKNKES